MNPTLKEAEHNACFTALPALLSDRRIGVKYATGHSFWGEMGKKSFFVADSDTIGQFTVWFLALNHRLFLEGV